MLRNSNLQGTYTSEFGGRDLQVRWLAMQDRLEPDWQGPAGPCNKNRESVIEQRLLAFKGIQECWCGLSVQHKPQEPKNRETVSPQLEACWDDVVPKASFPCQIRCCIFFSLNDSSQGLLFHRCGNKRTSKPSKKKESELFPFNLRIIPSVKELTPSSSLMRMLSEFITGPARLWLTPWWWQSLQSSMYQRTVIEGTALSSWKRRLYLQWPRELPDGWRCFAVWLGWWKLWYWPVQDCKRGDWLSKVRPVRTDQGNKVVAEDQIHGGMLNAELYSASVQTGEGWWKPYSGRSESIYKLTPLRWHHFR